MDHTACGACDNTNGFRDLREGKFECGVEKALTFQFFFEEVEAGEEFSYP